MPKTNGILAPLIYMLIVLTDEWHGRLRVAVFLGDGTFYGGVIFYELLPNVIENSREQSASARSFTWLH